MELIQYILSFKKYEPVIEQEGAINTHLRTCLPWTKEKHGLCLALNRAYLEQALANSNIEAVIISKELKKYINSKNILVITAAEPELLFCDLHINALHAFKNKKMNIQSNIAPSASIHPTAIIEENITIGERVCIGPYSIIHTNSIIEDDVWIGPHVVIGAEGLYSRNFYGEKKHLPQWGGVKIEKKCRIAAQCIIAKSTYAYEYTHLEDNVHLSFNVTVGHDCTIGAGSSISSHATIGGRTIIGKNCWLGIGAVISNTVTIGDEASVKLGAIVIDCVNPKAHVSGNFAISHFQNLKNKAAKA